MAATLVATPDPEPRPAPRSPDLQRVDLARTLPGPTAIQLGDRILAAWQLSFSTTTATGGAR